MGQRIWMAEEIDRQLGAERGPNGEPSANDFQVFELLRIMILCGDDPAFRDSRRREPSQRLA
jgi:hypothetical protein